MDGNLIADKLGFIKVKIKYPESKIITPKKAEPILSLASFVFIGSPVDIKYINPDQIKTPSKIKPEIETAKLKTYFMY